MPSSSQKSSLPKIPSELSLRKTLMMACGIQVLAKYTAEIYRKSFYSLMKGERAKFPGLPARFGEEMADITEYCLDYDVKVEGAFPKLEDDERGVIISNHPNDHYFWSWVDVVAQNFSPNLRATAKKEMLYDPKTLPPILAWPATLGHMMIPIDRKDPQSAIASIREGCKSIFQPGDALFIFPDGHRPTQEKIAQSHSRNAKRHDNLSASMPYTCFPKSRGLETILKATQEHPVRILNMMVGSDQLPWNENVIGSTFHVYGEEVKCEDLLGPSSNGNKQALHLQEWVIGNGIRTNQMIGEWIQA